MLDGGCFIELSTHDLTQRSTEELKQFFDKLKLSTHDLTQRSTDMVGGKYLAFDLSTHDLTQRSTHQEFSCVPFP